MAKEGYSQKGYTSYHGEPLDSATTSKTRTMKGGTKKDDASNFKGGITKYQGEPLDTATTNK